MSWKQVPGSNLDLLQTAVGGELSAPNWGKSVATLFLDDANKLKPSSITPMPRQMEKYDKTILKEHIRTMYD